jgi:quercetin dioxygenase-like cupin family protein
MDKDIFVTEDGCLVVTAEAGREVRSPSGAPTLLKASGQETQDLVAVFEQTAAPRSGPPLHIHHESAEMFYVLEGAFVFKAGAQDLDAPAGTFVFVPKGVAHTYVNAGDEPARILFWFTPAARMTDYFKELSELPVGPIDPSKLDAIARRHGVEIVGDPLKPGNQ